MIIAKDLVFNLFIILVCYSLFITLEIRKHGKVKLLKVIFASVAVILCMSFPYEFSEGLFIDLRLVPIALVGLYGGWRICILLTFILIGYRLILGGEGLYYAVVIAIVHSLLVAILSKYFLVFTLRKRIFLGFGVGLISPILLYLIKVFIFSDRISTFDLFVTMFFHLAALGFFILLSELIIKIKNLYDHVSRIEKMKIVNYVASSFTHEIRNPLTTVKGFLQLMKRHELSREELDNYISIAVREVDRAESIITEYLSFAKPTNETLDVINGEQVLESSVDVIRPLANSNCVDIKFSATPFFMKANKQKLQQALINMFKNAIEAMPDGGTLFVSVNLQEELAFVTIKDTGMGMTEEQVMRLGEPYFSSKGEKGTGLGMMVVYNIIGAIGGTITVESQIGEGTTFVLSLPISEHVRDVLIGEQYPAKKLSITEKSATITRN